MDKAIIVQGPITQMEYDFIRDAWGSHQLIISTWEGNTTEFQSPHNIIYNRIPNDTGIQNLNLQRVSTLAGLLKAKELGYTHALKIRNDMYPTNAQALLDCMDWDKLNLLAWHNHREGYITDYIISGELTDIFTLFDINTYGPYSEWCLTNRLFKSELSTKTNYFLNSINKENDVYWNHKGQFKRLSDYHTFPLYTIKQPNIWKTN